MREEQEHVVKRISFTREQEQQICEVLNDDKYKVINKQEIKVIYYLGMSGTSRTGSQTIV